MKFFNKTRKFFSADKSHPLHRENRQYAFSYKAHSDFNLVFNPVFWSDSTSWENAKRWGDSYVKKEMQELSEHPVYRIIHDAELVPSVEHSCDEEIEEEDLPF